MQHQFEFIANLTNGDKVHMMYKGKTSRKSKVRNKIVTDLKTMYNIEPNQIGDIFLNPTK